MPLPANVTTVTVLGTFLTPEGDPSTGTVSFTPSSWLLNSGANIAIPNSSVVKTLGTAGDFSAVLPITDDPDLSPGGWVYSVSEVVDGVSQSYNIAIPGTVAAGGTVFLADLAPVAPAGPEYYSLASSLAIGTVTKIAPGGNPTATITGLAPSQTLDLGLVTGDTGSVSTLGTGSAGTAAISPTGDANTGLFFPAADTVAVTTGGTERLRVDSSGRLLRGHTSSITVGGLNPLIQSHAVANSATVAGITLSNWQTGTQGNSINFLKSRGGTIGTNAASSSGDGIATIGCAADDGSGFVSAVEIRATVDGTVAAGDVPGRLGIFTKPSGGAITERLRVDSNGLITGTGTSLGAWTAYTPTIGGTGWDLGNGTATGLYCQIGKVIHFSAIITLGSTSVGGAGSLTVSVPVTMKSSARFAINVQATDTSASVAYFLGATSSSTTAILVGTPGTNGLRGAFTGTSPFTVGDTDVIRVNGTYEAN